MSPLEGQLTLLEPAAAPWHVAAIIEGYFSLDGTLARAKANDNFPLHALNALGITNGDCGTAVRLCPYDIVNRRNSGERVAIWKIPLNATGDPRTAECHHRVLHDGIRIQDIALSRLVEDFVNVTAKFR